MAVCCFVLLGKFVIGIFFGRLSPTESQVNPDDCDAMVWNGCIDARIVALLRSHVELSPIQSHLCRRHHGTCMDTDCASFILDCSSRSIADIQSIKSGSLRPSMWEHCSMFIVPLFA